jgi:N utilization substance protein B
MSSSPSTPRHRAREIALQILYRFDESNTPIPQGIALAKEIESHFEHFQAPEAVRGFAAELVAGTLTQRSDLDSQIEKKASNWKMQRMSSVDRNLLRMSLYEMGNFPDIPVSVTLDEAVELAKQFGTAESPSFVNGLLDALKPSRG